MKLSSSSIKKFVIFSYISGNRNPKKLLIFQKTVTFKPKLQIKKKKKSAQKNFLYLTKWKFLISYKTPLGDTGFTLIKRY